MSVNEIVKIEKNAYRKISAFFTGFFAPFDAFSFIFGNKGIKRYFIIPFILNLLVLCLLFYFSFTYLHPILKEYIPVGDAWYIILLQTLSTILLVLVLAIISVFLYAIVGSLVSAPFHDPLSAKVEKILNVELLEPDMSIKMIITDLLRIVKNIVKLLILIIFFNLILFIINFFPPLGNILYVILSFLSLVFFFGFQFFEFPLERRKLTFHSKLKIIFSYKWLTFGIGTSFFILSIIPVVGFLSLSLGTVAGTKLFVDKIKDNVIVTKGDSVIDF